MINNNFPRVALGCSLLCCGMLYSLALPAQDLVGVYQLAKQNDSLIREARERMNSAREIKPQAKALLLPTLSASGELDWIDDDIRSSSSGRWEESYTQHSLELGVRQPIYHRDYWIQLEQADNSVAQAEATLASAEIDLMVRTTRAYFDVLAAADNLRTAQAEKEANARQLEQAQQRFDVGLVAITDVHEAKAAYDNAVANELTAENTLNNAWEALRKIVGDTREPVAKLGEDLPLTPPQPQDIEKWAETAQRQNFDIIAAREAAEVAKKKIEIENAGHYPTVDLIGAYGLSDSNSTAGSDRDRALVGLQLEVPLYQGGAVTSRTRQARYDYQAAQEVLDQKRREINRQVRDAYRGVLATISRVNALKSTVQSFTSALESTQAGLDVGTRTMVDVLAVTKSLYQAERDYYRARYDYVINALLLHQAASSLTLELLEKANGWLVAEDTVPPPT